MIDQIITTQRAYFHSGATLDINFRRQMLKKLQTALAKWEKPLADALWTDLHKSYEEAYLTELSIVKGEIANHIRHIGKWSRRKRKPTPIKMFPSRSYIVSEPLGNTLIIAPWNYPVQLLLNPLVGAISAGCTAVLKPSPYVPAVSNVLAEMIAETFEPHYIALVQGHRDVNQALFAERFDLIFFTGSPSLGKQVMEAASKHLTPVVLELGGKSPCIVDREADIRTAAKRIAWGKTLNSGQTCIAPDYLLIHESVKDEFVKEFGKAVKALHGSDIKEHKHYVRIVSDRAFERVKGYLAEGDILYGGRTDATERFIEPTLLDMHISLNDNDADAKANTKAVLTEEIFGPIFPILTFNNISEVTAYITRREKPLAFYYFGNEANGWDIVRHTSSGGACINDTIMHIANEHIPFGGVGNSGMGGYHREESFRVFSHRRSVVATGTWIDLPFRYMPYKMFGLVKKIV
ncbi:MAG: aldehyde dehydrogenase family protein [Bacteroidaceae bacterium]|nr:aldehyde dehydrogenase family protein [Bacteroidaceae bacterium]